MFLLLFKPNSDSFSNLEIINTTYLMKESVPGKVDEKATQLHAIASLKVLLDATKPQRGAATSSAANHVKINLKETTLSRPNGNIDAALETVSFFFVYECVEISRLQLIALLIGTGGRRARSSQHGMAIRNERSHNLLARRTNHLSIVVNTPRHENSPRQEILSHHFSRFHRMDRHLLLSHGVVGNGHWWYCEYSTRSKWLIWLNLIFSLSYSRKIINCIFTTFPYRWWV